MRQFKIFWLFLLPLFMLGVARAQDVKIVSPQEGQDVRGEITVRYEGVPAGGYAQIKIDGQFLTASAQDFIMLDTISDRVTFARGDAAYKIEVTVLNAGGKRVGTDSVTFNIANNKVDEGSASVKLVHWIPEDRLNGGVQRYRVFAESNAVISGGSSAGGGGGGGLGAAPGGVSLAGGPSGGAGAAGGSYLAAPLDFQVSALLRRVVRDTSLLSGSANISTIVQEAFTRQRLTAPVTADEVKSANPMAKGPWAHDDHRVPVWSPADETGKYFIKMIQQNGTEINATRKAPSVPIADLLPTFLDEPVRPGSTWQTTMSLIGDLSSRKAINVLAPITFSAYESIQTPGGETRRCAKLESRFDLPEPLAKKVAANLGNAVGSGGGAGGAAPGGGLGGALSAPAGGGGLSGAGGSAGGSGTLTADDIEVASTRVARVIWFDVQRRKILRAEDTLQTNFEMPASAATGGLGGSTPGGGGLAPLGGAMGGGLDAGGGAAAPAEPQKISYNLKVTTWLDDRIPNPTGSYLPGGGLAHSRDSVQEPGITRILTSPAAR